MNVDRRGGEKRGYVQGFWAGCICTYLDEAFFRFPCLSGTRKHWDFYQREYIMNHEARGSKVRGVSEERRMKNEVLCIGPNC